MISFKACGNVNVELNNGFIKERCDEATVAIADLFNNGRKIKGVKSAKTYRSVTSVKVDELYLGIDILWNVGVNGFNDGLKLIEVILVCELASDLLV